MLVRSDVGGFEVCDALQLDRGLTTIQADEGVTTVGADVAVLFQVRQRMTFQVQLVVTGDEVVNEGVAPFIGPEELEQIMAFAADHRFVASATDEGVMALATHHGGRASAADELRGRSAAEQRHLTADGDILGHVMRFGDLELTAEEGRRTQGAAALNARDGRLTLLKNRRGATADVNRVAPSRAQLGNQAALQQGERVVAA